MTFSKKNTMGTHRTLIVCPMKSEAASRIAMLIWRLLQRHNIAMR
jgi:hypothetical protein